MQKHSARHWLKTCSASLLSVLGLVSCSGGDEDPARATAPRIELFSATPSAVAAGGETRLSWKVGEADTVTIEPTPGPVAATGSLVLRPATDTLYTLTASNAAGSSTQNLSVATLTYDWSALDPMLDQEVPDTFDGYVFQLMVDGVTVYRRAAGSLQLDSAILIASSSKALVAAALLTLVRDGLLDLDRPVEDYLGEDWPADKAEITTRMLLNHTAGLADDAPCLESALITLRSCARSIADMPLRFAPGTTFAYGANGYQVAGLIAERLSGQGFARFFDAALARPLGMGSTGFEGLNPRLAGGARSNADDYLRFSQMILAGGRVDQQQFLPGELVATLSQNQIEGLPRIQLPPGANANFNGYALGWWLSRPIQFGGLSRGPEIADPGAFGTVPWMDYDRRYAAILLLESDAVIGIRIWDRLRTPILQQLASQS